jgi:phosphatidate phosphatase LPIN
VRADKKADEGEYDESGCDAEEQQGGLNDSANVLENCSVPLMSETSLLPIPGTGSELHSGDDSIEAKSLPNLRSHIHDLERSDSLQLSRSLCCNPENNCSEAVNDMNFTEKEPEATSDPKENIKAAELTSNSMPEDKHTTDLKVDSFNPVAGEFRFLLGDNIVEFDYSSTTSVPFYLSSVSSKIN